MKILLIGGSKSGKSMLAQTLCRRLAGDNPMYYWATMEPTDSEDRARIENHLLERDGWGFETVECGRELPRAIPQLAKDSTVLFDSLTALLANEMFGETMDEHAAARALDGIRALGAAAKHLVCVCDNLWCDGEDYGEWTERYRAGLAHICRSLAAEYDTVCEVTAGIPHCYKGTLL